VLELAQERVRLAQRAHPLGLDEAALGEDARASRVEVERRSALAAAAHHLVQLHAELDLADAAAPTLMSSAFRREIAVSKMRACRSRSAPSIP
jgi:hypothetical protein